LETDIFYFIIVQPTPEPDINALDFTSVFSLVGINFEIGILRCFFFFFQYGTDSMLSNIVPRLSGVDFQWKSGVYSAGN